jgi:hypothetical protein
MISHRTHGDLNQGVSTLLRAPKNPVSGNTVCAGDETIKPLREPAVFDDLLYHVTVTQQPKVL